MTESQIQVKNSTPPHPPAPKSGGRGTQNANRSPQKPHVAPQKAKSRVKAFPGTKARRWAKKADRTNSKKAQVFDLLHKSKGATLAALIKATGWQAHSVRGFLSGTVGKKLGLKLKSIKGDDGERVYSIK